MNNPFAMMQGISALGNMGDMIQKFQQFQRTFQGDPEQQIRAMLQSGKISQQQLDQAQNIARQLGGAMGLFK